jgi:hypothetical protein
MADAPAGRTESLLRGLILALLTFGLLGLTAELVALGHYEDSWQLVSLILNVLALAVIGWHAVGGGAPSLRVFQVVMAALILAGALGILLHYRANVEFQLEIDPTMSGWPLLAKALHAKTPPALAPGAMVQLGLMGLIFAFRHPALRRV